MGQHRDYAALMTVSKNICVTGYCHCLNMVIYVRWKIDLFCLWHSAQHCQVTAATHTGKKKSIKAICIFGCSCNSSCRTSAPACCRYLMITASIGLWSLSGKSFDDGFFFQASGEKRPVFIMLFFVQLIQIRSCYNSFNIISLLISV